MKLKERPAKPYMTGSELPPAQLLRPPEPHAAPPDTCKVEEMSSTVLSAINDTT